MDGPICRAVAATRACCLVTGGVAGGGGGMNRNTLQVRRLQAIHRSIIDGIDQRWRHDTGISAVMYDTRAWYRHHHHVSIAPCLNKLAHGCIHCHWLGDHSVAAVTEIPYRYKALFEC